MIELNDRPKIKTGVVGSLVENEMVVVLPEKGQVKVINQVGSEVWNLLDGTNSTQQIIDKISTVYEISEDIIRDDILEFLETLLEKEMITCDSVETSASSKSAT